MFEPRVIFTKYNFIHFAASLLVTNAYSIFLSLLVLPLGLLFSFVLSLSQPRTSPFPQLWGQGLEPLTPSQGWAASPRSEHGSILIVLSVGKAKHLSRSMRIIHITKESWQMTHLSSLHILKPHIFLCSNLYYFTFNMC